MPAAGVEQDDVAAPGPVSTPDRPDGDDLTGLDRRLHADTPLGEPIGPADRRGTAAPARPDHHSDDQQRQQPPHPADPVRTRRHRVVGPRSSSSSPPQARRRQAPPRPSTDSAVARQRFAPLAVSRSSIFRAGRPPARANPWPAAGPWAQLRRWTCRSPRAGKSRCVPALSRPRCSSPPR